MATFVRMPQKGLTEESAILASWHVKEGDSVKEGQYLFALETGKATFDVEAEVPGTVLKILAAVGEEVPIKRVVCVIGTPGEAYTIPAGDALKAQEAPSLTGAPAAGSPAPASQTTDAKPAPGSPLPLASIAAKAAVTEKIKISPRARRLALAQGLDYSRISGTGPGGRVIEEDVKAALAAVPKTKDASGAQIAAGDYTVLPFTPMRRAIAAAMQESLAGAAQFTLHAACDATQLLAYRERYNAAAEEKLSITDLIAFALSRTLLRFPHLNAHSAEEGLYLFKTVNLGIAVDTPRGLVVPVVRNAETKSLAQLSREIRALVTRSREGKALPDELTGGTFTLSNMGKGRVSFFTPILNPPQTGILGTGTIEYRRKISDGQMLDYQALSLSLTVDHRLVDGAPAGVFLSELCEGIESFPLLLV